MSKRLSVIVSQGQSNHPHKRAVEEQIVTSLLGKPGIEVAVVPHLYDLTPDSPGMLCLSGITGDMIICSWLFPRAAHWTLDRQGIRGNVGTSQIPAYGFDQDDDAVDTEDEEDIESANGEPPRVVDQRDLPSRTIFCLDLRTCDAAEPYLEEIDRIAREAAVEIVPLDFHGNGDIKDSGDNLVNGSPVSAGVETEATVEITPAALATPGSSDEATARRWYPVIDFGRCTNCLECIDFCLFGVYGIDGAETILVEQPDNCRKGCPACSRVCPENAILFPQHKTPTIAGSPEIAGPVKIDLSRLFGAPDPGAPGEAKAQDIAILERDEQLLAAGREAVGAAVGIHEPSIPNQPKTQSLSDGPKDELDALIDQLDELDW